MREKDYSISFVRFVATIMIIVCHIYQYYCVSWTFWFNAAIQIFFFMSGFLYANKEISDPIKFMIGRFKRILIPYYLFVVVACAIGLIFAPEECTWQDVMELLVLRVDGNYLALHNLWFVGHIMLLYFMTPLILKWMNYIEQKKKAVTVLAIILTFVGMYLFIALYTEYKPYSIICYFMGIVYGRAKVRCKKGFIISIDIIVVVIMLISCSLQYYVQENHLQDMIDANKYDMYIEWQTVNHVLMGMGLFVVLSSIYKLFNRLSKNNLCGAFLDLSDRYSYNIYIVHQIFILGAFSLYAVIDNVWIATVAVFAASILSAIVLQLPTDLLINMMSKKREEQ